MSKPKVLITGGTGFLGSHLCDWFLSEGCHVVTVDNLLASKKSFYNRWITS